MTALGTLCSALLGILIATIPQTAPQPPSFSIYLIKHTDDDRVPGFKGSRTKYISEIELEAKPLITDDDILSYDLRQHAMKLTKQALARIPRTPPVRTLPFLVVANGERIYLGVFTSSLSSFAPGCPAILVDRNVEHFVLEGQESIPKAPPDDILMIDRGYPQALFSHLSAPDPRSDPRIVRALTALRKLKAINEWLIWHTGSVRDEATPLSNYPLKKQSTALDHYLDNLLVIHPELYFDLKRNADQKLDPKVSVVGKWHGFDVYDVIEVSRHLKQIVLESPPGMYRILYSLASSRVIPGPSRIVTVQGKSILVTSSPPLDPDRPFEEKLFLLDDLSGLPTELNVEAVIGSALWEILPDQFLNKAVSPFDLQTLTYKAPVFKDAKPAGSVEIRLGFQGSELVPIYKKYDPEI